MNNDDRELQIKLAQLQTDIQTYLTINVSFIAVFVAMVISFQQLAVQATEAFHTCIYFGGMIILSILAFVVTKMYTDKMTEKRKEMDALRKEFVW